MQDGQPRRIQISTDMLPDQKRLALWRETRGPIAKADIDPQTDDPHHAGVIFNLLPNVAIASGSRSPAHYRAARELLEDAGDIVAVSILRSGEASATQFGREPGEQSIGGAGVLPGVDPTAEMPTPDESFITLAMSRAAIAELAPDYAAAFDQPIPADDPALRLLIKYLDTVMAADELSHPEVARSVSAHILDLVALVLGARGDPAETTPGGARAARLKALKADVMSMLGSSELSSELIAGRHGISSRYVRKLFEQEGTSFTSFVLGERLTRVKRMLRDSRYAHLTIAQIAQACGFNDISYFNRAFRRQFGATPTDVREEKSLSSDG